VRLTIDSAEPLDTVLKVVGDLYGVVLVGPGQQPVDDDGPGATPKPRHG
jgi:hypothetical protein